MATTKRFRLGLNPIFHAPLRYWQMNGDYGTFFNSADKKYFIFQAPKAGVITQLGFRVMTGYGTYSLLLQGVDGSGIPNGVTKASASYESLNDDSGLAFNWATCSPSYTCQRGELLSIAISMSAGLGGLPVDRIATCILMNGYDVNFPYQIKHETAGNTKVGMSPIYGCKFDDGTAFGLPAHFITYGVGAFSYPQQQGLRFVLNSTWGEVFRVAGVRWQGRTTTVGSRYYDLKIYEGQIPRQSVRVRTNVSAIRDGGSDCCISEIIFDDDPLPDLTFGTEYFLVIAPQFGDMESIVDSVECLSSGDLEALPGGNDFYWAERTSDSDSWTTNNARRPVIDLIIDWWGKPAAPAVGPHLKFLPRYNSNLFIEHADDQIRDLGEEIDGAPHESVCTVIGNAIKSYGGYKTVEVFKDPDTEFSIDYRILEEQDIEKLKILAWDGMTTSGLYRIVFRFRTVAGSEYYTDYEQWLRVP